MSKYVAESCPSTPPPPLCHAQGTPLDSEMGWTGELFSNTIIFKWQNKVNICLRAKQVRFFIYLFIFLDFCLTIFELFLNFCLRF